MTSIPFRHGVGLLICVLLANASLADSTEKLRFNRDIRPLLSENCFHCHGPDQANRKADLRLDSEDGIRAAFEGGLEDSEAWRRINSDDADELMPPKESHKDLEPEEIRVIGQWIADGAPWEVHWSFNPITKPEVPSVDHVGWSSSPIDAFVFKQLSAIGQSPNEEADRERLLRRVTLALTGLPPTIDEIDAFLADTSPEAYEKVVDRLLKSQHFGERMALVWMDAARYGDTSVFHADGPRTMWPWRDWVIDAYNNNMPFDQFTLQQLAGDLMPDGSAENKLATAFLRNNATTDEGGAIAEEFRVEYAVDRVATVSKVWMGLSMECAQCHNHKYDPISQDDYYRVFAYFNQASDPGMQTRRGNQTPIQDLFDKAKLARAEELKPQREQAKQDQQQRRTDGEKDLAQWLEKASAEAGDAPSMPEGEIFYAAMDESKGRDVAFVGQTEGKGKLKGPELWVEGHSSGAFRCDTKNFIDFGNLADFERDQPFSYGCWIRPEGNPSGAIIARMENNNAFRGFDVMLSGGTVEVHIVNTWPTNAIKVRSKKKIAKDKWQHLFVTYDGSSKAAGIKIYIDGKNVPWDIEQDRLSETIRTKVPLYVGRRNPDSPFRGLIDDVRIYGRTLSDTEVATVSEQDPIRPLLAKSAADRSEAEKTQLVNHYFNAIDKPYRDLSKKIVQLDREITELTKPYVNVMVMKDVPQMRKTFVLDRGNYDSPNKEREVQPGVPGALPPLPEGAPSNRLGLAQWLVSPEHPLTARVTVNRYWATLFGEGIVKSLADFGAQGQWPSHPDLLDWLAADFVESGWDIKRMIKQMVMSATFRQSSRSDAKQREADPENRRFVHGPRYRLQGEFIRDNALSASGLLVSKIGGPGVKPYQPPGLWNEVSLSGNVQFVQDHDENLYRRSMYIYWKRSSPAPAMTTFDAPTREKCVLRRSRTNTPLQALVTMNDVQFVEAARMLAERVIKQSGDSTSDQIILAYRLCTGTRPTDSTLSILQQAYDEEKEIFAATPDRADKLLALGEKKRDESIDKTQHAAMTIVASMILNLDATLSVH